MQSNQILYALPIILLFVALRLWRGGRARKMRVEMMWIRPLIILALLGVSIYVQPPPMTAIIIGIMVVAAIAGVAFGWWRGGMVRISIDTETHALTSQQSPWGTLIFLAIMLVRFGIRYVIADQHEVAGIPVAAIVDGITIFYGGNILGMQLEQWLRAQRLVAETVAAKAAGKAVPTEVTQAHAGDPSQAGHG